MADPFEVIDEVMHNVTSGNLEERLGLVGIDREKFDSYLRENLVHFLIAGIGTGLDLQNIMIGHAMLYFLIGIEYEQRRVSEGL